ncbi:MAG: hypothetical protein R3E95_07990 [Thiolinea sp.]
MHTSPLCLRLSIQNPPNINPVNRILSRHCCFDLSQPSLERIMSENQDTPASTSLLDYLIVGLVILFFGLLYFLLNHGSSLWSGFNRDPEAKTPVSVTRPASELAGQRPEAGQAAEIEPDAAATRVTAADNDHEKNEVVAEKTMVDADNDMKSPADQADKALASSAAERAQMKPEPQPEAASASRMTVKPPTKADNATRSKTDKPVRQQTPSLITTSLLQLRQISQNG